MANRVMEKADTDPAFNSRGWQYWQQEVQLGSCVLPMRNFGGPNCSIAVGMELSV